jgi:hypothetical protein
MVNAGNLLVSCPGVNGASCNPSTTVTASGQSGDGIVGSSTWATGATWAAPGYGTTTTGTTAPAAVDDERYLFFSHLLLANFLVNVTPAGLSSTTTYAFGVTHPNLKIGGGLQVGYSAGNVPPGSPVASGGISGTVLLHITGPQLTGSVGTQTAGTYVLTPLQAAMIDMKMDDGQPSTGYVQAFGVASSCMDTIAADGGSATAPVYHTSVASADCGLIFRIEN